MVMDDDLFIVWKLDIISCRKFVDWVDYMVFDAGQVSYDNCLALGVRRENNCICD